jgi:hypothetical protein
MKKLFSDYGGIIVGGLYGLAMRLSFALDFDFDNETTRLLTITFVMVVPVIIGIAPMMFATKEQLESNTFRITRPFLAVLVFALLALITGLEDLICILVMGFPFCSAAAIGGYIFAKIMLHRKGKNGTMYLLFLLPFLTAFAEEHFPTPSQIYRVSTETIINSSPELIWENVVRVRDIDASEYNEGFFNYAGIPRPLYAELDKDTVGATRTGHFEGGLTFLETVTHWERNKKVAFDIVVVPSSIRPTIFDQHILKGKHFRFLNASYELEPLNAQQTKVTLTSSYKLDTKINAYGAWWGRTFLNDFQERLLQVIKNRTDNKE